MRTIAPLEVINSRLEEAMKTKGIRADDLMPQAGLSRATWYSWMNGSEGGIRQVCVIADLLGLRPDQLVLQSQIAEVPHLDSAQISALDEIARHCGQISRMTHGKKKPAVALANMLREVIENFEHVEADTVPPGTEISVPEKGVKVYVPPKRNGSSQAKGTAEGNAKYGKRKSR